MKFNIIGNNGYLPILFIVFELFATPTDSADTSTAVKEDRLNVVQLKDSVKDSESTFKNLRHEAGVGTGLFFTGVALNYTMAIVSANANISNDCAIALLIPTIFSHGLKFTGVPVACSRASKASDLYTSGLSCPQNICWGFYGGGWACEAIGTIFGLSALLGDSEGAEGFAIAALFSAGARDILWTLACITSISHIRKIERAENQKKFSFYPVISFKGSTGIGLSYRF